MSAENSLPRRGDLRSAPVAADYRQNVLDPNHDRIATS